MLQVQVQYWIRELRHLVRRVDDKELVFDWRDEIHRDETQHYLAHRLLPRVRARRSRAPPSARARTGCRTTAPPSAMLTCTADGPLDSSSSARTRRPSPWATGEEPDQLELRSYLCGRCLRYNEDRGKCGAEACPGKIPARAHVKLSEKKKFLADCPRCGGSDCLSMLGSRAASLCSVAISHLFLSPYNDDRKLLAFLRLGPGRVASCGLLLGPDLPVRAADRDPGCPREQRGADPTSGVCRSARGALGDPALAAEARGHLHGARPAGAPRLREVRGHRTRANGPPRLPPLGPMPCSRLGSAGRSRESMALGSSSGAASRTPAPRPLRSMPTRWPTPGGSSRSLSTRRGRRSSRIR